MDDITSPRPFENDEEVSTLSTLLKSQLNLHNVSCPFQAEADATDVTNYILELVEDNETVGQIINEVRDLGFTEICTEETLEALRVKLAEFLVGMEGRGWKNKWEAAVRKDTEQQQQQQNNNSSAAAATITPPMTPTKTEVKEKEISSSPSPSSSSSRPTLQKQNSVSDSDYYKEIQARLTAKNTTVETIGSQSAGRKLTYAEEIQAREKARGESVVKNSAAMQASGSGRGGIRNDTVEANGQGYSGSNTKRQMSYAEEIQAREKARGEEIVKNSAAMQASGTARGNIRNDTIESNGKGALYQTTSGKRQMSYAEEIQARERARGEAIVKNSAKAQSGQRRASLHSYTSSASGASAEGENEGSGGTNNNHEERGHSPDSVNADLSGRSVDVDVKQDLDQMRREELMIVMKDRSLSREEKAMKMKEIREKYA